MLPTARGDDDNNDDGKGLIPGNIGMNIFVAQYVVANNGAKFVSCYLVTIHNPLQYDYIVALLSAGLSFRQISRVVQDNHNLLGAASKLGGVSEGDTSNFSRVTCALGLQMIADLMSNSWVFSVANDVLTDGRLWQISPRRAYLNARARRHQLYIFVSSTGVPAFRGSAQRCLAIHLFLESF